MPSNLLEQAGRQSKGEAQRSRQDHQPHLHSAGEVQAGSRTTKVEEAGVAGIGCCRLVEGGLGSAGLR